MYLLTKYTRSAWGAFLVVLLAWGCTQSEPGPVESRQSGEALSATGAKGKTETVWVLLKQQADLRPAASLGDWAQRGKEVHRRLRTTAASSQAGLLGTLARTNAQVRSFWIVNALQVTADKGTIASIAADPAVAAVYPDRVYELPPIKPGATQATINGLEWGVSAVRAPEAWQTFGVRGEGVVIANIDTGVDFQHPALVQQYRGNLGGTFDHDYNWFDPANICPGDEPCDNSDHGTHTMGTMVGNDEAGDNRIGVAPGAKWIAAKGCEESSCSTASLLAAGQWMLAPTDSNGQNPRPDLRPNIVNNSWGGGGEDPFYQSIVQAWIASGIFPVFSNGNSGSSCSTAGSPGDYAESYAVGAYAVDGTIANFSSRGPGLGDVMKPNIAAPGVDVRSSIPGGGYASFQGTSMAAPHLAGVVALMWSAAPSLLGNIALTESLLNQTAVDTNDTTCGGTAQNNNVWGEGKVDAFAAVDMSPRGPTGVLAGAVATVGGAAIPGASVSVTGPSMRSVVADSAGNFSMTLPVGTYEVTASGYGYTPATVTGQNVTEGGTTNVNFALEAAPSVTLSGIVRANAQPVAGVAVTLSGSPLSTVTDVDGRYHFASVLIGNYTLVVGAPERCIGGETRAVSVLTETVQDFNLVAPQDAFGYQCRSVPLAYVDAANVLALGGDDNATTVSLPFAFPFYGGSYTTAYISTNGHVNFQALNTTYSNSSLPNPVTPNLAIYGFWDDLFIDSSSSVRIDTVGTAPNRNFVIEYRSAAFFSGEGRIDFEILLGENGSVRIQYRDLEGSREQGSSATVGLENLSGSVAFQYSYNEAALLPSLAVEYAVRSSDVTPPTVALTAPADGVVLTGLATLSADATDDVALARVEFVVDLGTAAEAVLGSDAAAPFAVEWNTALATPGAHQIIARAFDAAGNSADSATANVTVDNPPDVTPPVVNISSPADGALVTALVQVQAAASDDVGVQSVDLLVDGMLVASSSADLFVFEWDSRSFVDGAHDLEVVARDLAGNTSTSPTVTVLSDNTAPTLEITAPAPGTLLRGTTLVAAVATDASSVERVEFRADGALLSSDTTAPYAADWDTRLLSDGNHELTAVAFDILGNSVASTITVATDNTGPVVAITAPAQNATVSGLVTVNAAATDLSSGVQQVEFLVDGVSLGVDVTSPYTATWNAAAASTGVHVLTAVALDLAGNVQTAPPVNVTVPAPFQSYWFEAELGSPSSPLRVTNDMTASAGRFLEVTPGNNSAGSAPNNGRATYSFTATSAGTFRLWGRTITPSVSDDSFWVQVDNGTWAKWNLIPRATTWAWDDVHHDNNGSLTQLTFALTAGAHTIKVAYREDGTKLDRLMITNDLAFVPSGAGPGSPPPAPSALSATAGDGQVSLLWSGVANASSYLVKRGLRGGPYSDVASGLTGTAHAETGLANGQEYCYVVAAVNADGVGANSAEACATPCTGAACGPVFKLEAVTAVVGATSQTVTLANSYTAPVVVCSTRYANNNLPLVPRVSQVTASNFNVRLQVAGAGTPTNSSVYCLVVESGNWFVDGVRLEAHTVQSTSTQSDGDWNAPSVVLAQTYTNPVVVGQVMSENDARWSVFWARGAAAGDPPVAGNVRMGKHVAEDTTVARATETLGYIAFERGHGTLGGVAYEAGVGANVVQGVTQRSPYRSAFLTPFAQAPAFAVVSSAGMNGANGGWPVLVGANPFTTTALGLGIDEDTIGDSERAHPAEQVAYVSFQTLARIPGQL
ncbi:MAG: hypothetical protein RJA70_3837 [Pseudomonadota bacterium]|jgi:subtilisin family serine protease